MNYKCEGWGNLNTHSSIHYLSINLTRIRLSLHPSLKSQTNKGRVQCISCPFLIRQMRSLSGKVRSIRQKVLCMHKTWNRLHRKKVTAGCTVAICWHAFRLELVHSLSCTCLGCVR